MSPPERAFMVVVMPRRPRLQFAGAVYHVMSRGNARRRIFRSDRERFLRQLRDNLATYDVALIFRV